MNNRVHPKIAEEQFRHALAFLLAEYGKDRQTGLSPETLAIALIGMIEKFEKEKLKSNEDTHRDEGGH